MRNQKLEGQIRHVASGLGYAAVLFGLISEQQSMELASLVVAAGGALLALGAHVRSLMTK